MPSYDPTIFNVSPYYDDFNEEKKFLRMLFRPGYAVQSRELTQLQTILQNQIERFGNHVFKDGSNKNTILNVLFVIPLELLCHFKSVILSILFILSMLM